MTLRTPHVLIADDDAYLTRQLARRFEEMGYNATTSPDTMHALSCVHRNKFDLIVMDITMPAGNGLAACEMLHTDNRLDHIPVIILTGSNDVATRLRCQRLGAHHLLKTGDLWPRLQALAGLLVHSPSAA